MRERGVFMKCTNCGAELPKGELYCPTCGQEVQWVPNYDTLETIMIQQRAEEEKAAKQKTKEQEEKRTREEERRKKLQEKKKTKLWVTLCISGIVILLVLIFLVNHMTYQSFDYQMDQAESAYTNKQYEKAFDYAERALDLEPDNPDATLLLAKLYLGQGEEDTALPILKTIIKNNPDNMEAYNQLIVLYDKQGDHEAIKELLDNCEEEKVLERFEDYLVQAPAVSLEEGEYTEKQTVFLYPEDEKDMIYYTLNGKEPSETSEVYTADGIELGEGEHTLQVMAVNEKGMHSDIITVKYTIVLKAPDTPVISPSSGEYREETKIQVVNIPQGCIAYYAFDETPTTSSRQYTRPVTMPEGEHIFSVIIVDENGKASNVASETYAFYNY